MTRSTASSRLVGRHARQSGYSIVEMAIVLVAFGLLVSGASWAFGKYIIKQQDESELARMRILSDSVVSYALNTRTPGMVIEYSRVGEKTNLSEPLPPLESAVGRQYIPAGRPILPCPDITGDGWEDRTGPSQSLKYVSDNQNIYRIFYRYRDEVTTNTPNIDFSTVLGRCIDSKGWLPWRTLKTNPADVWGIRYMYWADPRFTMVPFGFDATTRASNIFKHAVKFSVPRTASDYCAAIANRQNAKSGPAYRYSVSYDSTPVFSMQAEELIGNVVLSDYKNPKSRRYFPLPGIVRSVSSRTGNIIIGGDVVGDNLHRARKETRRTSAAGTRKIEVYEYCSLSNSSLRSPAEMADGIAYAILSHGVNGHGGLMYNGSATTQNRDSQCIPFPIFNSAKRLPYPSNFGNYTSEASNAVLNVYCTFIDDRLSESDPENAIRTDDNNCKITNLPYYPCRFSVSEIFSFKQSPSFARRNSLNTENFFVLPKTSPYTNFTFDDILVWATPKQLYAELTKAGLPVLRPPAVVVLP